MSIAVLGAGAFGTALAISLAQEGQDITLWARSEDHADAMKNNRENSLRLPDMAFPGSLAITSVIDTIKGKQTLLLAVPTQQLLPFVQAHQTQLADKTLVVCCKGIDLHTGLGPTQVLKSILPNTPSAILTGPSFANDIAGGLPTALTIVCEDAELGFSLQSKLSTSNLRLYRSTDVIGAELGGALKNVIAIAFDLRL